MCALSAPNLNNVVLAEIEWRALLAFLHAQRAATADSQATATLPTGTPADRDDAQHLLRHLGTNAALSPDETGVQLAATTILDQLIGAITAQTGLVAHEHLL